MVRKMNGAVIKLSLVFFQLELCVAVAVVGVLKAFAGDTVSLFDVCVSGHTLLSSLTK